jgi:hypothetical protein
MVKERVQTLEVLTPKPLRTNPMPHRAFVREVQNLIRQSLHCESRHLNSSRVEERGPDGAIWRGDVETFELVGHPEAQRCFAWAYSEGGKFFHVIVLEEPPVFGPASAVLSAL